MTKLWNLTKLYKVKQRKHINSMNETIMSTSNESTVLTQRKGLVSSLNFWWKAKNLKTIVFNNKKIFWTANIAAFESFVSLYEKAWWKINFDKRKMLKLIYKLEESFKNCFCLRYV